MEVFISGVSKRETETNLRDFLEDILMRLKIEDWSCEKRTGNAWAKLFFLRLEDGRRFLSLHGKTKDIFGRHSLYPGSTNLLFKGRLLNCKLSNTQDTIAFRSLEWNKEAREEQKRTPAKSNEKSTRKEYQVVECTSMSCGLWDYIEDKVVFKSYFPCRESAKMTFKSRFILFKTDTGRRLDISHSSIEAVVWEGLPTPAMTFTLREAPRIFQSTNVNPPTQPNDLISLMEDLFGDHGLSTDRGPQRDRVPGLDQDHQRIAGSCLVYRFSLAETRELNAQVKALSQAHGMSSMTRRQINVRKPSEPYATEFSRLQQLLSPPTSLPFAITFQVQKLAQNGYLPPSKVIRLLPEVKRMASRSGKSVTVNAIRKLFLQIPYAGPDTDHTFFRLESLVNMLRKNEEILNNGGLYSDELIETENVAVIHKAIVTPAGIYLYGPERESNNRVLRKYSKHHDNFLRVQFCDEDVQPVQFNYEVSNKPVYDRFRGVLNKGIHIAGQQFSFLGFSHSSLRAQSCWFMAPFVHNGSLLFDRELIKGLGNFSHIQIPARCAARIGQAFSDTRYAITLAPGVVKEMPDVEDNGRVFSDGVGTISMDALEQIWNGLLRGRKEKPTVLQIRYQGTCS
jgi:hypothetical protein